MDKRLRSALSIGYLSKQRHDVYILDEYNIKTNLNNDEVYYKYTNNKNYESNPNPEFCIPTHNPIPKSIFYGLYSFTVRDNTILLNILINENNGQCVLYRSNNYIKKQYIINKISYIDGSIIAYSSSYPKLKLEVKMFKDYRLSSNLKLILENYRYKYWVESSLVSSRYDNRYDKFYFDINKTTDLELTEMDNCKENRSKYCLLSALQRLAVYKSLYYILPDIYLLGKAFKMFCKRQHGINHNAFLKAHKNY